MATLAEQPHHKPWSMARVVIASSAGTAFEWYDFFIFGSLAPVISKVFFAGLDPTPALIAALAPLRRRLRVPPARRADLRSHRRPSRPQGRVPGHRQPDGHRDLPDRLSTDLRAGGDARADIAHHPARPPGHRARRRIWRRGDLRRRACAQRQARRFHRMDPGIGVVRTARCAAGDRRHAHMGRRGCVPRLGVARALPLLGRPARNLRMDARQARRKPGIRPAARRGRDHQGAAARSLLQLAQSEARADRFLRHHVRPRSGLVLHLLLPAGVPREIARAAEPDEGPAADRDDRRQRAALRLFRLAQRPRRPQAGHDRRDAARARPLFPGVALDRQRRQPGAGRSAKFNADLRRDQSSDLLGAVRSGRHRKVHQRLRHRQEHPGHQGHLVQNAGVGHRPDECDHRHRNPADPGWRRPQRAAR